MGTHLTSDELIDIAEGTRSDAAFPHVRSCAECRQQIADLRATMSIAAEADLPVPSPLFWDHLSTRVRAAIEAERGPQFRGGVFARARTGLRPRSWMSWTTVTALGVAAAVVIAVYWTAPEHLASIVR